VDVLKAISILSTLIPKPVKQPSPFAKEEKKEDKKEEKKEEPKSEPEKKRSGGVVGSASKRADGCAVRGKTKGRIV
jgi:ribosomal protein L12E/L44/L45/RPP1/RPP2